MNDCHHTLVAMIHTEMSHLQKVDCSEHSPSANLGQHHPPHLGQQRHKHKQLNAGSSIHLYLSNKSETTDSGQQLIYLSIYYTALSTFPEH